MYEGKRVGVVIKGAEWPRGIVTDGSDHNAIRVELDAGHSITVGWKDVEPLSECCGAWPKGTDSGIVCRACYADMN